MATLGPIPNSQRPPQPSLGTAAYGDPSLSGVSPHPPEQPELDPNQPFGVMFGNFGPYGGTALDRALAMTQVVAGRALPEVISAGRVDAVIGSGVIDTATGNLRVQVAPPDAGNMAP